MATYMGISIRKSSTEVVVIDTENKEHIISYPGGVIIEELAEDK